MWKLSSRNAGKWRKLHRYQWGERTSYMSINNKVYLYWRPRSRLIATRAKISDGMTSHYFSHGRVISLRNFTSSVIITTNGLIHSFGNKTNKQQREWHKCECNELKEIIPYHNWQRWFLFQCQLVPDACFHYEENTRCHNYPGGYSCMPCPAGHKGKSTDDVWSTCFYPIYLY